MDGQGFTEHTWDTLKVWTGGCATPHDVDAGAAVFALTDTLNGRPMEWMLPQPVIWYEEDEEFAAVVVQAEAHETEAGETLEVLGLVLPTGKTAVAFTEDVEEVDGVDATWIALLEAELDPVGDDGAEDEDGVFAEADDPDAEWDKDPDGGEVIDEDEAAVMHEARGEADAVHKDDEDVEP